MKYLSWEEKNILSSVGEMPSEKIISEMYGRGYVFTRVGKGVMQQTRTVRIDLAKFELSSENRRILKKVPGLELKEVTLPLSTAVGTEKAGYHWSIAKTAKDFYEKKFGAGVMTAAKIKELLTDTTKSNFNLFLGFVTKKNDAEGGDVIAGGGAICYKNSTLLHYSYPFYDLAKPDVPKDMGLGMMILTIEHAKSLGLAYVYLGSLQRPSDSYKLQFRGLEWFDGGPDGSGTWQTDIEKVKNILK